MKENQFQNRRFILDGLEDTSFYQHEDVDGLSWWLGTNPFKECGVDSLEWKVR